MLPANPLFWICNQIRPFFKMQITSILFASLASLAEAAVLWDGRFNT